MMEIAAFETLLFLILRLQENCQQHYFTVRSRFRCSIEAPAMRWSPQHLAQRLGNIALLSRFLFRLVRR